MKYIKKYEEAYKNVIKIRDNEMEEILKELKPWFPNSVIRGSQILDFENYGNPILDFSLSCIKNSYSTVYDHVEFKRDDVFEEIGHSLEEIKVKKRPFDIELWKKGFAERHSDFCYLNGRCVRRRTNQNLIVFVDNDINFAGWNKSMFQKKSLQFKFDGCEKIYLKTLDDCLEFERQFRIMKKYLQNAPDLNGGK